MPEIKHQFTRGRMQKDLDERLIPNGEYRDAMNIQVSTSQAGESLGGSEVGTVQNILGNSLVPGQAFLGEDSKCVGSIADEKNDKLYWLVISHRKDNVLEDGWPIRNKDWDPSATGEERAANGESPPESWNFPTESAWQYVSGLFVTFDEETGVSINSALNSAQYPAFKQDVELEDGKTYSLTYTILESEVDLGVVTQSGTAYQADPGTNKFFIVGNMGLGGNNAYRPVKDMELTEGRFTHTFTFDQAANNNSNKMRAVFELTNKNAPTLVPKRLRVKNIKLILHDTSRVLEYDTRLNLVRPVFVDLNNTLLEFSEDRPITGINIVDDMLFWTDNFSEPKKINITRCKEGTAVSSNVDTMVINHEQGIDIEDGVMYTKRDISVMKQSPRKALDLEFDLVRNPDESHTGIIKISDSLVAENSFLGSSVGDIYDFSLLKIGDTFRVKIEHELDGGETFRLDWKEGTKLAIKEFDQDGQPPSIPVVNHRLKGTITGWRNNNFVNKPRQLIVNQKFIHGPGGVGGQGGGMAENWVAYGEWTWDATYETAVYDGGANAGTNDKLRQHFTDENGTQIQLVEGKQYRVRYRVSDIDENTPMEGKIRVWLLDDVGSSGRKVNWYHTTPDRYSHVFTWTQETAGGGFGYEASTFNHANYKNSIMFETKEDSGNVFRGRIDSVYVEELDYEQAAVEVKITSIDGTPPDDVDSIGLKYAVDTFDEEEKLFEFKFPRFSYRYKYKDNEYSPFAPFSNIAFAPGNFGYEPNKGFNLGMTNTLKALKIRGFASNIPSDVVSIDILYKEEHSPNIYIVDTIKDLSTTMYKLSAETINGVVPSNQLLRHWDNVPRKALGQEVTGSRIVYANYLQNYDLKDSLSNRDYKLDLAVSLRSMKGSDGLGENSIKSLREYQVGVVYSDEFGRETPVLTNNTATLKVNKDEADNVNRFSVHIKNDGHPVNMKYFKFFIKDNSNQYYNLAMDRYYDADDHNIWLAFPSSDRNKVDIDDFLILKKGIGTNSLVRAQAKYKVLDIQNEAPEFIKREIKRIYQKPHYNENNKELFITGHLPEEDGTNFAIDFQRVRLSAFANIASVMENKGETDKLFVSFNHPGTGFSSKKYEVVNVNVDAVTDSSPSANNIVYFEVGEQFGNEINEFTNDPTGDNPTKIINGTYLNVWTSKVSNSPRFDGRFFVKIYNNDVFKVNIIPQVDLDNVDYVVARDGRKRIYSMESDPDEGMRLINHRENIWKGSADTTSNTGLIKNVVAWGDERSWKGYMQTLIHMCNDFGTLNGHRLDKDADSFDDVEQDDTRSVARLLDHDAYFRGINLDPRDSKHVLIPKYRKSNLDYHDKDATNQAFQDVWFIDGGYNSGNFMYSHASKNLGWDSSPDETWKTRGKGIKNIRNQGENNYAIIDLSFGGIQPIKWKKSLDGPFKEEDVSFYDIGNANTGYSPQEGKFIEHIAIGSQFRFKQDPDQTVYTIMDVEYFYRVKFETLKHQVHDIFGTQAGGIMGLLGFTTGHTAVPDEYIDEVTGEAVQSLGYTQRELFDFNLIARNADMITADISGITDDFDPNTGFETHSNIYSYINNNLEPMISVYRGAPFLRPSNFVMNYRLKVIRQGIEEGEDTVLWNPWHDTGGDKIEVGAAKSKVVLTATAGCTTAPYNYVQTSSIIDASNGPSDGNVLKVGMVLKNYDDTSGGDTDGMSPRGIVWKISESGGTYTIYLKTLNSVDNNGKGSNSTLEWASSGEGSPADIANGDTLYFFWYPMNRMSPNSAKNINFWNDGDGDNGTVAGTAAIGYDLEFVEVAEDPEDQLVPINPAIWETEPKEKNVDLDVYYEASDFLPVIGDKTTIEDIIPKGSIISHIGSNKIPRGTQVIDIDHDTGKLTLSRQIEVEKDMALYQATANQGFQVQGQQQGGVIGGQGGGGQQAQGGGVGPTTGTGATGGASGAAE